MAAATRQQAYRQLPQQEHTGNLAKTFENDNQCQHFVTSKNNLSTDLLRLFQLFQYRRVFECGNILRNFFTLGNGT